MPLSNPKVKSVFSLLLDEVDYSTDITSFKLYSEPLPKERITFSKYADGVAVKWWLEIDAVFDGGSAGSLHDFLWTNAGANATFNIKPFQDFDPLTKRFYQGSVRIQFKPDMKIQSGEISTYSYKFKVIGQPVRSDSPGGFLTEGYYETY
jgi:hypothetical protein